ncbi:lysophospholipid acyltransferase family protein [Testudinibacter sp. TR-2022]|uniref:lysophospholipid acyltransferase family protein n=1 Tax=Testudinibacter sp. TR-2022 TaxID=2585029 RepID=UPI00159BEB62|nr:lysophospholipid acyltransferase family protein [Testudinibacter sp. TR-2022]
MLGNIWMLILRLVYRDQRQRRLRSQQSVSFCFKLFVNGLKYFRVIDYQIDGAEVLQQDRGCLIVANHPTLLDYVLIGSILPEMDCVVKESLFHNPFCKMVVRNAGYIANTADPQPLFEACKLRLSQGGKMLIFPEGTRSSLDAIYGAAPLKLQRGAANLAVRCGVPLRIVHISCRPLILNKSMKWYQLTDKKAFFYLKVQHLEPVEPYLNPDIPPSRAVRELNAKLTELLQPTTDVVHFAENHLCKH